MTRAELLAFRTQYEALITPEVRDLVRLGLNNALVELQRQTNRIAQAHGISIPIRLFMW
jgi:hypothetical protein